MRSSFATAVLFSNGRAEYAGATMNAVHQVENCENRQEKSTLRKRSE
jgi:hypothetical protein